MPWETWTVRTTLWRVGHLLLTLADFSDFSDLNQLLSGLPLADQRTLPMCATDHKRPATRGHVMCHVKHIHGGPWRLSCFKLEQEIWFTVHGLNPRISTNRLKYDWSALKLWVRIFRSSHHRSVCQFISSSFCCGVLRPFSALLGLPTARTERGFSLLLAPSCAVLRAEFRSQPLKSSNYRKSLEITYKTKGQKDFLVEFIIDLTTWLHFCWMWKGFHNSFRHLLLTKKLL